MLANYSSLTPKEIRDIEAERRENQKRKYGKIGGAPKKTTPAKKASPAKKATPAKKTTSTIKATTAKKR